MRSKTTLLQDFDDVKILMQHLYMDGANSIVYNNGLTDLSVTMTEDFHFMCKNLSFPNIPASNFDEQMTLPYMLGIIDVLKETKAVEFPERFTNRWDEIKTITLMNLSLNAQHS